MFSLIKATYQSWYNRSNSKKRSFKNFIKNQMIPNKYRQSKQWHTIDKKNNNLPCLYHSHKSVQCVWSINNYLLCTGKKSELWQTINLEKRRQSQMRQRDDELYISKKGNCRQWVSDECFEYNPIRQDLSTSNDMLDKLFCFNVNKQLWYISFFI